VCCFQFDSDPDFATRHRTGGQRSVQGSGEARFSHFPCPPNPRTLEPFIISPSSSPRFFFKLTLFDGIGDRNVHPGLGKAARPAAFYMAVFTSLSFSGVISIALVINPEGPFIFL
jgi:hypothetical protein